ncbi:MAG TPA: amidase [Candidatus Binatia bacterium]|nr:amidase [Candidatus Binatia bacterium]
MQRTVPASAEDLAFLSVAGLAALLRAKKLSPVELVRVYLERIARLNPRLNAFLTVPQENAIEEAERAEREIARGKWRGPLHGIPIAVKDNIESRGVRTTAGSKILASFVPQRDAPVLARLRQAGAILLGKTHLHEFAYGVTSENVHYGPARNPHDPGRIPGGSSGGSAIAVAAGLCAAAVGTDTGGSIRIPAALCGVTGFKPAFGALPMEGIVPLCRSLDHVGPITRTVEDAGILYAAMRGEKHAPLPRARRPGKLRLGWPRDYFFERLSPEVARALEDARRLLRAKGVEFVDVALPLLEAANRASLPVALAEAYQFHRAAGYFPARAAEYSDDVRARLERGEAVTAADYLDAREAFQRSRAEWAKCAERVEALLVPSVPIVPPRIGEASITLGDVQEEVRAVLLRLCRPANFWGAPAISVPCGATPAGLPIGMQFIGFEGRETLLLELAHSFESATDWHRHRPSL